MSPIRPASDLPLASRVAVVTGACSGIGAATARLLALRGARVALLAASKEGLDRQLAAMRVAGADAMAIAVDVTDQDALDAAHRTIAASFGIVNLVVNNNTHVLLPGPIVDKRTADWDHMISLNLVAALRVLGAFLPSLLEAAADGCPTDLVHVSAVAALDAYPDQAVYSSTQAAIGALSRHLRVELHARDIRVSLLETDMVETNGPVGLAYRGTVDGLAGTRQETDLPYADHVADAIAFATGLPRHIHVRQLTLKRIQWPI